MNVVDSLRVVTASLLIFWHLVGEISSHRSRCNNAPIGGEKARSLLAMYRATDYGGIRTGAFP